MATIKSYTDISQSKKLAEFLPPESADTIWDLTNPDLPTVRAIPYEDSDYDNKYLNIIAAWSLAALLNILHSRQDDIPSLSGGGYKDGNYISDWCLDYEYDNGNYQKTFADNPVDACVEMILKLHELNLI